MKAKTWIFKNGKYVFCYLLFVALFSCSDDNKASSSMVDILSRCKGHVIVIAKGYNEGNFKSNRHYLILKDDSANCFEYAGAEYSLSVGDTIR
jgi:hypothetical protein